eukprot:6491478-Amphidinium_carterae.1
MLLFIGFCFFALAILHTFRVVWHTGLCMLTRANGACFVASSMPYNSKCCYPVRSIALALSILFLEHGTRRVTVRVIQLEFFSCTHCLRYFRWSDSERARMSLYTLCSLTGIYHNIAKPAVHHLARTYVRRGTAERNNNDNYFDSFRSLTTLACLHTLPDTLGMANSAPLRDFLPERCKVQKFLRIN